MYLNLGGGVSTSASTFHIGSEIPNDSITQTLAGCKQWLVVPIPTAYSGANWPIRVCNFIFYTYIVYQNFCTMILYYMYIIIF